MHIREEEADNLPPAFEGTMYIHNAEELEEDTLEDRADDVEGLDNGTSGSNACNNLYQDPEAMSILERTTASQQEQIERLHRELNKSRVQHREEVYWLRLELDSSRRDKEAVEDRMAELYRDVQEMSDAPAGNASAQDEESPAVACIEPDYVSALQDRLTAYERSVGILNRQIEMLKTSAEVVVASMKQEVTDLMEEKTMVERDLLNQISSLDTTRRRLEIELSARRAAVRHPTPVNVPNWHESASDDQTVGIESPADNTAAGVNAMRELSLQSIGTTQGSSRSFTDHDDELNLQQLLERSRGEIEKWKKEAEASTMDNIKLKGKLDEVTKDLTLTRSSANVALALDRIERDREETLSQLDRITTLWDRADRTVLVVEGLLSDFHPRSGEQEGTSAYQTDRHRLVSTLETATLVHGQIKMSLTLIELSFRNHLTRIQDDNLHLPRNEQLIYRMEEIRNETLSAIEDAEVKWTVAVAEVEKQKLAENTSINGALNVQLGVLQKIQERHMLLEHELEELKKRPFTSQNEATLVFEASPSDSLVVNGIEDQSLRNGMPPSVVLVSRGVMARLQKEIFAVVELVEQKNEAIILLMNTIDNHRLREEVLKKELTRFSEKSRNNHSKDGDGKAGKHNLDLTSVLSSSKGKKDKKASTCNGKDLAAPFFLAPESQCVPPVVVHRSSPRKIKSPRHKPVPNIKRAIMGSTHGWSSL
jgi:hypothetical protein